MRDLSPTVTKITLFGSLIEALEEGFTVDTPTADGYIVKKRASDGWVLGIVEVKKGRKAVAKRTVE